MLLYYQDKGRGTPVVLLHGMAASHHYWDSYASLLAPKHRVLSLDLLGFGRSPMPTTATYTYEEHLASILETLEAAGLKQPFILVGHSMGALLALRLAATYLGKVSKLVLLNMPIYRNEGEARADITKSKKRLRLLYYGPSSRFVCTLWCRLMRPLSKRLAPYYLRRLPKAVAQDSVLHTWQSYAQSLHNVIEQQHVQKDLYALPMPVQILYGNRDDQTVLANVRRLGLKKNMTLQIVPGTHNIVLEKPNFVADVIG